jgi:hypothetical protein
MPGSVAADAAREIVCGWEAGRFEIPPKRFTLRRKRFLADGAYFMAIRRSTGL